MELNVPSSGEVSNESPAVVQLHDDTKVPVSEIKAKLHNKVMELNQQRLAKPSEVPFGHTTDDMRDQSYSEVEDELLHPEEQQETQEYRRNRASDIHRILDDGVPQFATHTCRRRLFLPRGCEEIRQTASTVI